MKTLKNIAMLILIAALGFFSPMLAAELAMDGMDNEIDE
jgi:hypothetical protein